MAKKIGVMTILLVAFSTISKGEWFVHLMNSRPFVKGASEKFFPANSETQAFLYVKTGENEAIPIFKSGEPTYFKSNATVIAIER